MKNAEVKILTITCEGGRDKLQVKIIRNDGVIYKGWVVRQ